jgi:hypothetical protein
MGWFFTGMVIGTVLSAGAVVVATEFQHGRRLRPLRRHNGDSTGLFENEMDIVEGLSHVVSEGLGVMADAVARIGESFSSQRRETIRYDLGTGGASGHGASSHGWYTGEDDDDAAEAVIHDPEYGDVQPMPS